MKQRGIDTKYPRNLINDAIKDYENNDLSWEETAEKHKIPKSVLQYHRRKKKNSK